jgi:hypothetical protein
MLTQVDEGNMLLAFWLVCLDEWSWVIFHLESHFFFLHLTRGPAFYEIQGHCSSRLEIISITFFFIFRRWILLLLLIVFFFCFFAALLATGENRTDRISQVIQRCFERENLIPFTPRTDSYVISVSVLLLKEN